MITEEKAIQEGTRVSYSSQLSVTNCHACGGTYAMSVRFMEKRKSDGGAWTCPYCNQATVFRESDVAVLKQELAKQKESTAYQRREKERYLARSDKLRRQRDGMKGVLVREQKKLSRVRQGACPCCNRHFKNLRRHMDGQHPDYKKELLA